MSTMSSKTAAVAIAAVVKRCCCRGLVSALPIVRNRIPGYFARRPDHRSSSVEVSAEVAPVVGGSLATSMKVLIIEDELKTASYLKKGLSESGFVVDVAS